ncbi:YkgJ family cysteine cluster protein [Candidatus Woesearchaeota archaeon]|nr:YkgJ family cysteine cluster protein [Candidatus Woesearchaeota archaeon]
MGKGIVISKDTPAEEVERLGQNECADCVHCCSYGAGIVLPDEKKRLAAFFEMPDAEFETLYLESHELFNTKVHKFKTERKQGRPHGRCIFLTDDGCSIHRIKPLHCRVGTCTELGEQISLWFTLNHLVNPDDPESIRQWAVYLKTHDTIPGGELHHLVPDKEKLKKILSYEILR